MKNNYIEVVEVIKAGKSFLVCSHAHPDGDGIGSTLAIGRVLELMGKQVVMYNEDGVPRSIDFLPFADKIVTSIDKKQRFDVVLMVDCCQSERAGRDFPTKDKWNTLVCIDHHVSGCNEVNICCLDESAASTGAVVYNIIKELEGKIDADIATLILTTIIVDTGFFRYSNTLSGTLSMASELVAAGARPWVISQNMEEREHPAKLRLLSKALDTIDYQFDGKLAVMILTDQMFKQAGADVEMAEDFINYPRSIEGVRVAVLIREKSPNEYKISFRSKEEIDVAKLCLQFGGGGHARAAGCNLNGSLGSVRQTILKAVSEVL